MPSAGRPILPATTFNSNPMNLSVYQMSRDGDVNTEEYLMVDALASMPS